MAILAAHPLNTLRVISPPWRRQSPLTLAQTLPAILRVLGIPRSSELGHHSSENSVPNSSAIAARSSSCSLPLAPRSSSFGTAAVGQVVASTFPSELCLSRVRSLSGVGVFSSSCCGAAGVYRVRRRRTSPIAAGFSSRRVLPLRVLLVISASAAIIFLRRRRTLQQLKARGSAGFKEGEKMVPKLKRIDTHLHVWASPEEAKRFPYFPGQEPTLPGSANELLKCMAEAGVDGAVIVQPINHKFDHSYVSSVLQKFPTKFVGMCLADPTEGGGGVKELERLVKEEGYGGVRFNPYIWPSGQKMTNEVGKAMFAKAGELGIPVGFMCFKGLMLHIDEIEELCEEFPTTTVLMDHLGFCRPPLNGEEDDWTRLLNLSKYPQVYVKLSAFFRVSREPYPYKDTWPLVKQLLESFGADHLMWGSDFPFVAAECGYTNAWRVLPSADSADCFFSDVENEALMGGTALTVFKGGWRNAYTGPDELDLDSAQVSQYL